MDAHTYRTVLENEQDMANDELDMEDDDLSEELLRDVPDDDAELRASTMTRSEEKVQDERTEGVTDAANYEP
eukprot:5713493-Karenia_brevis.AAC.1